MPRADMVQVANFFLPLPPLAEQQRIVARLDAAFAAIAEATAAADANLRNARALFNSYLDQVFSQRGPGWVEQRLGDVAKTNYGYTESATYDHVGPKFLRITDLQDNKVNWETVPYCPIGESEIHKYRLAPGDIVFARTGATTGKSFLVENCPEAVFASYLIRVRLEEANIDSRFINYYFRTSEYWKIINAGIAGSAQGGFSASKLCEIVLPYPTALSSQKMYVEQIENYGSFTSQLLKINTQKLAALAELKQALLAEVFGEG